MVSLAAFGPYDPGTNPAGLLSQIQIENCVVTIIKACGTLASRLTLQWGASL